MHPGKPFPQPTPYAHKPPEPSKSRPWDSPSPRWRAGRSGASCARARSCKSDSPRPYARAAYTAMHGTSAGAARTGAGTYTAGQAHARGAGDEFRCARDGGMGRVGCFYSACTEAVVVPAPAPFAVPPRPMFAPCPPPSPRVRAVPAHTLSRVRVRAVRIVPAPAPAHPCALPAPAKAAPTCAPGPAYVPCPRIGALPAYTPCPCTPCPRPSTCIRGLGAGPRAHAGAVADAGMAQGSARARTRAKHVRIRGGELGRYSADAGTVQGGRGRVCAVCRRMQALPRRVPHVHVRSRPTFAPAAMRPRPRTRHTRRARAHDTYVHVPYTPCERPRTPTHWYAPYAPCQRRNYVYVLCHAPTPALAPHPPPPAPRPPLCACRAREPAHVYAPHAHLCPRTCTRPMHTFARAPEFEPTLLSSTAR
ncbi:hypothetical protein GGX14DRAFT_586949 [Mycena pura]|uniref:Uncharacterized protein n=1 Tax=Mycena pura TaxID=153505 RepID=A0AAD6Y126_9AGAR|nr:hypothetical protein GGX14DRAFT_586949 [Mycena pura]